MTILSVKNLYKKFSNPDFIAVDGISFDLQKGQVLGFLGPNGAGKTTTIQMLLSTMTPTSGEIIYFGKNLADHRSEILSKVGFASTYVSLPGKLTVYENLFFYGQLYGVSRIILKDRLETLLKKFDMWHIKDRRAGTLSAGQMTRVMLIKAFCIEPQVMLLDEPTASLDPDVAQEVLHFIKEQQKHQGVSILFTSHKMDEVAQICDSVLVLKKGSIIAHDTPERLARLAGLARVELIVENPQEVLDWCIKNGIQAHAEGCLVSAKFEEHAIADYLIRLAQAGLTYRQITIDKPTLEDYFLQISR
ncbi:MAG: ABC transporter ATP-binding protein [Candidatus Babeliaceae bacterium]|nr:ABC transporter ATP-binding protein [Candidatus Babeliaceae bacterium]